MKELKLLLLEKGDSQKNLVDKSNFNFSQILSFEGGPYGKIGPEGKTGVPGSEGPTGSFGPQGKRGNTWEVSITQPLNPSNGDYWLNPLSNNEVKVYNSSTGNWDFYSINISGLDLFREFGPLQTGSGPSPKNGYFISLPFPELTTFVISDSYLSDGSPTANPQYSKMVISTDSQIPNRRIMEFTKGPYHGTLFSQETPYFSWSSGPTSSVGNYALDFISPKSLDFDLGGDFKLKSTSSSISLKSGPFISGYGINKYITGTYSSSANGNLVINVNSGLGSLLFSGKNISYTTPASSTIVANLNLRSSNILFSSGASLILTSQNPNLGNLYYKMDVASPLNSSRSASTLFKATDSGGEINILEISGKGDFKIDKAVYPLHPLTNPTRVILPPFSPDPGWAVTHFFPSVSPAFTTVGFNASRGVDYYLVPSTSISGEILVIYTPSTGEGWLDLIDNNEYMNFRVHSSNPNKGFNAIGIYDGTLIYDYVSSSFSDYCTSVEFTIINISQTSSGTGPSDRWFKVLYQLWGGSLSTPICREIYVPGSTP
jgi:hypothetical protein